MENNGLICFILLWIVSVCYSAWWRDGQQCPYYIPRGHLNITCIREPGQICNFTCDKGYQPSISPSTIACGSNLKWNHNPASLCQETICPKYFEGGYVSEFCSRKYKATCYDFQCNPGYIKLAFPVKCDESGKWINLYDISPACVNSSTLTFRTTTPATTMSTSSLFPTLWSSKSYFNDGNDGRSGNGNLGTIVGTTVGCLTGILIIFIFTGWMIKRSSARKSQRRETGGVGSGCLRPRENPLQDITTIQQQPNTNGMGNVLSFESPSYNGIYVHPFLQRISTISSSFNYSDPPPSYSKALIAPNEDPPTYEEVVSNHSRFKFYN